jgi:hypothetical protein
MITSRRSLVEAVAAASIGEHVRVEEVDRQLRCVGGDGTLVVCVDAEGGVVAAETTLPCALLSKLLRGLTADDIDIVLQAHSCTITTPTSRVEVVAAGRLPPVPVVSEEQFRDLDDPASFASALRFALNSALQDTSRPQVSGVRIDGAWLVGCDRARIHRAALASAVSPIAATLPCSGAEAIIDAIAACTPPKPKKGAAPQPWPRIRIAVGDRAVALKTPQRLVFVRREIEPYCDWRRIIEWGAAVCTVTAKRDVLSAALRGCLGDVAELSVLSNTLHISWAARDGARTLGLGSVDVPVAAVGTLVQPLRVSLAALTSALDGMGDDVTMSMSPSQPLRVESLDRLAVILFLR